MIEIHESHMMQDKRDGNICIVCLACTCHSKAEVLRSPCVPEKVVHMKDI